MLFSRCTGESHRTVCAHRCTTPARAGLGIRLVLALGVRAQINRALRDSGVEPHYKAGKRVTDAASMQAAAAAAAAVRIEVEARLSRVRGRCWRRRALAASTVKQAPGGAYDC
jgi:acetylglutamate kinase